MGNIVTIGYSTEGSTDRRFLESIIKRTFENTALMCDGTIEVYDPVYIDFPKNLGGFVDSVNKLSSIAFETGIFVLCIHSDADSSTDSNTYNYKMNPAIASLNGLAENFCKIVVPIVPIHMSEAWMLADRNLFKTEIGTDKTDNELGINRNPEIIANPKFLIEEALRISQEHLPARRRRLIIDELYQPLGQNIDTGILETLPSYMKFKNEVIQAFKKLNYLH